VLHTLPAEPRSSNTRLSTCITNIPRLISVVEIIKREYLKTREVDQLRGLHQYNEIGCLETDEPREVELAEALEGKNQLVKFATM
jgi:hypothetical protein